MNHVACCAVRKTRNRSYGVRVGPGAMSPLSGGAGGAGGADTGVGVGTQSAGGGCSSGARTPSTTVVPGRIQSPARGSVLRTT